MRVLHLYKNSKPNSFGGVEQFIDELCYGTSKLGIKNTVLTLSNLKKSEEFEYKNYTIIQVKRNFSIFSTDFSIQSIYKFNELISNVDLVHLHFPWPFGDLIYFLAKIKKPTIITYHSDIVKQKKLYFFYRPLMNILLRNVNGIVATSPNYLETSLVLKKYINKVTVIPIGLDEKGRINTNLELINNIKINFGDKFFLFIGSFRYYKGLNFLFEAARKFEGTIVVAGSFSSFDLINIPNNVFILGKVDDLYKYSLLEACYAVVLPSNLRSEAFGISLLEGAMFGKPLISCKIGTGTSFINIHSITGLEIEPSNSKSLLNALKWLSSNTVEAKKMGINSRNRYNKLFTSNIMCKSYINLYKNILL